MVKTIRESISALPAPVRLCWSLNLILDLICVFIMGRWNYMLHRTSPYRSPVMHFQHWWDFNVYAERFQHFHNIEFFTTRVNSQYPFEYPAPVAILYALFYLTNSHPVRVYLAVTCCLLLAAAVVLVRQLRKSSIHPVIAISFVLTTAVLSYPLWFEGVLGNVEVYVFLMLVAATIFYINDKPLACAVVIGLAASMKFYPAIYLGVFLSQRRYKPVFVAALVFITANVLSLWAVGPTFLLACQHIREGLADNRAHYMLNYLPIETGFDHSIFGLYKRLYFSHYRSAPTAHVLTVYLLVVAVCGLLLYALRIRKLPLINQFLALCVASILLPPTSHDYTLLHLYVPWALLMLVSIDVRRRHGSLPHGVTAAFVCFGILFAAESEFIHSGSGYSGQIKCLVLITLLFISTAKPWQSFYPQAQEV